MGWFQMRGREGSERLQWESRDGVSDHVQVEGRKDERAVPRMSRELRVGELSPEKVL